MTNRQKKLEDKVTHRLASHTDTVKNKLGLTLGYSYTCMLLCVMLPVKFLGAKRHI